MTLSLSAEQVAAYAEAMGVLPEDVNAATLRAYTDELEAGGWQGEARRTIGEADRLHEQNMAAMGKVAEPRPARPASHEDALFERLKEATGIR